MTDRYQAFTDSPVGKLLVKNLGLPNPTALERWKAGSDLVDGPILLGGDGSFVAGATKALTDLGVDVHTSPAEGTKYKGLVFDASGISSIEDLEQIHTFFKPLMRSLLPCARVLVLGLLPEKTSSVGARISQRGLEGFTRSLGKEIGKGSTVNLVYAAPGSEEASASTLAFFLSPKSAYVSGQVVKIGATGTKRATAPKDATQPLAGTVAIVTGASRGIGEQIARTLHRDGAKVLGIDIAQAASDLQKLMKELDGDSLVLDITAKDAPKRIAAHVKDNFGGVDAVVHNAGITRDKKLANMDEGRWNSVISVNLAAPQAITDELLEQGLINKNGRILGVSSIAGIAGNVGQTNYATSKAGVIGMVDAIAPELTNGITINAVAPGFIITQMTAAVPFATREVGQRMNAMSQGGLPIDVAETVAWFLSPGSTAVNGNVVRVCGQMMLGA